MEDPYANNSHQHPHSHPHPQTRRGPFKRLIVAADGTWLNSDDGSITGRRIIHSNVTRIARAIKAVSEDGIPQIVNYQYGVGSQGSVLDRALGGAVGVGLNQNIRENYSFLANNYLPGDEIFLIGFSRGAFAARTIAGTIAVVGLLTKIGLSHLGEVFRDVQNRRNPGYTPTDPNSPFPRKPNADDPRYREELRRRGLAYTDVNIKAIAVWDTVGSLGVPRVELFVKSGVQGTQSRLRQFYDTRLSNCIENAFQALALDERRTSFAPALWEKPAGNITTLRQVWFPGVHSNVGGGIDDQSLANISLAWMISQLLPFLDINTDVVLDEDEDNDDYFRENRARPRPWSFGEIPNSGSGLYALAGGTTRTPGRYYTVDPETGRETSQPLSDTHEYIHPSARSRFILQGPGVDDRGLYEARSLKDWKLIISNGDNQDSADVYWKLRTKERNVSTRILPESPLWEIERQLLYKDRRIARYVLDPPEEPRRSSKHNSKMKQNGHHRPRDGKI